MHWQIDCSDLCTSPTIGFSERLMSGIMLNYKLLFEGFMLLQLQLFPAIMVVLWRRSSKSILILLTDVPLKCRQKCWFRDLLKRRVNMYLLHWYIRENERVSVVAVRLPGVSLWPWEQNWLTSLQVRRTPVVVVVFLIVTPTYCTIYNMMLFDDK